MTQTNTSIHSEYFADYMRQCCVSSPATIAVAVSGGPDSMALLRLLKQWSHNSGTTIIALTADHGIRVASASEAAEVSAWCRTIGIRHEILKVTVPAPKTGVQAWARKERYGLLCQWCHDNGVRILALGHHRDDQVETILMRQERGSGVRGLAGMSAVNMLDDIVLIRPLLAHQKTELVATCESFDQPWVEDSSNTDLAYKRVQLRLEKQQLTNEGIAHYARQRTEIDTEIAHILQKTVSINECGAALCEITKWRHHDHKVQRYALKDMVMTIGGTRKQPRNHTLDHALQKLEQKIRFTFAGCVFQPKNDEWQVIREPERAKASVVLCDQSRVIWDNRFRVKAASEPIPKGCYVGALTASHYHAIKQELTAQPRQSSAVMATLPAIYASPQTDLDSLLAVPHLKWHKEQMHNDMWQCWFSPRKPLVGPEFTSIVVPEEQCAHYG